MTLPSIDDFGRRLRSGTITAAEVTESCLRQIAARNPQLNAFISVQADQARGQAQRADRDLATGLDRGPLHGVPISIKDLIDLAGTPTTAASDVRRGHIADQDAVVVARLRDAGAVIIGKTNLHEFALGTTNEDSAFGPARNPYDPRRSPGGSSGGAAISVADDMALAAIGTDTGGSIRIPAAACGIVGLKPRHGEISTDGVVPLSTSLDHVGPLCQTVADASMVYQVLVGAVPAWPRPPASMQAVRLAVPRPYFLDILDDEVRARFESALERVRQAGATVAEVEIPDTALIAGTYTPLMLFEAAAGHATTLAKMPERYSAPVRERLEMGQRVTADEYAHALERRERLRQAVDAALRGHDAIALPTLPIPAPLIGATSVRIGSNEVPIRALMLRLTQLFNLTGHPAIALPMGTTADGLPCSLQLAGATTPSIVQTALACETVLAVR